jgi:hypothetical protein
MRASTPAPPPARAAPAATPEPTSPPTLHHPWNPDITDRPYPSSTTTAWAFIATSASPAQAP